MFLQPFSHQMLVLWSPDIQIQSPESFKKVTWKQAWKKPPILVQGNRKALKMGTRHQRKSDKNPSLDPKVSFLEPPGAPGSSHGPPGCQSGGTRHAKWLVLDTKSDNIRLQNQSYLKKYDLETNIQKPASQHTFQQRNFNKKKPNSHKPTSQQSRKGPAAWAKP